MFNLEVYLDDSGTDGNSPIAVAASYVGTKDQWDDFTSEWKAIADEEGFEDFHMVEFVAKPECGHKPYCDWSNEKKIRVYSKLSAIINSHVLRGFAIAVPKPPFDEFAFAEFKNEYARNHYVWAAKNIIGLLEDWRKRSNITDPMQYVFHKGALGEEQLQQVWKDAIGRDFAREKYGIVPEGVMFQNAKRFKPLQAADILAWQVQNHLRKNLSVGKDPNLSENYHEGFKQLLPNELIDFGFYSRDQLKTLFDNTVIYKATHGVWPWHLAPLPT